ncbi:hypothetical protein IQ249_13255 [Lusitaniella coriacea LEGE 07157]|uniref:2OG-Fe(II) oxygenase n=1 Tax=Lusitaniella coriacea LEGE 07157 TaxID=945747 RepID=A0A8J7DYQ4_9CYAN|nr:sporadic carbohydrate cluster 2OG-Fe(II) oxygenase [Lusitaniella coriacea]MBE9116868.1 hypothetical protein [Lusitaniella coriacea LEGE 07157]
MKNPFFTLEENEIIQKFLENGYLIFPIKDITILNQIKVSLYEAGTKLLALEKKLGRDSFFDKTHTFVAVEQLNNFRVKLISHLAQDKSINHLVYFLGKQYLDRLVGNELAMQRSCNLSIQLPGDNSSLLPVHSDVWSGNSPYEVVFWLPLVDCYCTKSMFILPKPASDRVYQNFQEYSKLNSEEFFQAIQEQLVWLDVPYGHAVIFSHSLPHGNCVNKEKETRWTINVRFKSLLSPYGTKGLGESFLPITIRPTTRIGMSYTKPQCQ